MKNRKVSFLLSAIGIALVALVIVDVNRASAISITTSNLGAGFPGPYAELNISLSGQTATITVTSDTTGGFQYLMTDGSSVALSVNSSSFSIVNGAAGITGTNVGGGSISYTIENPPGTSNVNGFGSFNLVIDAANANIDNSATTISFQILNTGAAWGSIADVLIANDSTHNAIAAVHVGACSTPCTLDSSFAKTGFAAGSGDPTVPPTEVPEPATLLLLGSGLIAVAAFARRRFPTR
jgi:hypothetical protein